MGNKTRIKVSIWGIFSLLTLYFLNGEEFFLMMICAALHEAGHLIAMGICKVKPLEIRMGFLNFNIKYNKEITSYKTDLFISVSGPMMNFILSAFGFFMGCQSFFIANFILCIVNLLPIKSLDGGNILRAVLEKFSKKEKNGYELLFERIIALSAASAFAVLCGFNVSVVFTVVCAIVCDGLYF